MSLENTVSERFAAEFGEAPRFIVRAPGRVNLIGEHTDYNDGFVFPMAINRATWIALRPRDDNIVGAISLDMDDRREFSLDVLGRSADPDWFDYLVGVAWALRERGYALGGWEGVLAGDVPIGAGLSSSAALELATARAFYCVSGFEWDAAAMALACQTAENELAGREMRHHGPDDFGRRPAEDRALLIDCRSLETDSRPAAGRSPPSSSSIPARGAVWWIQPITNGANNARRPRGTSASSALCATSTRPDICGEGAQELDALSRKTRATRHQVKTTARCGRATR